jgi:hypothetical protein
MHQKFSRIQPKNLKMILNLLLKSQNNLTQCNQEEFNDNFHNFN